MRKLVVPVVLFAVLSSAQTRKLSIDDLLSGGEGFGRRGNEVLSRDGRVHVVVEREQITLKATGGDDRILTSSTQPKSELALSPDEQTVAYVSDGQIWTVSFKGGDEPTELTHDSAGPGDPRGATTSWCSQPSGRSPTASWRHHTSG